MVSSRLRIDGRYLSEHPLGQKDARPFKKNVVVVLAVQAPTSGRIDTPEGTMTFQAGDYILTDNPPTHAWPVRREVFERTYRRTSITLKRKGDPVALDPTISETPALSVPRRHVPNLRDERPPRPRRTVRGRTKR